MRSHPKPIKRKNPQQKKRRRKSDFLSFSGTYLLEKRFIIPIFHRMGPLYISEQNIKRESKG
jgi:hypothetical protein